MAKQKPASTTAPKLIAQLRALASPKVRAGLARFAIPDDKALGVPVTTLREIAKKNGRDHQLALDLWASDIFDARMLAPFLGEPDKLTLAQMNAWAKDFDNWAVCDAACFHLFDRSPLADACINKWAPSKHEFVRRAAFALIASIALHDKQAPDARFLPYLPLIEAAADDPRNFVKKGVSWALRGIGHRSPNLHAAATTLATKLAASTDPIHRWIGKDTLRDITRPLVLKRIAEKSQKPEPKPKEAATKKTKPK